MFDKERSKAGHRLWDALTWVFRILLVVAVAVFAFQCQGSERPSPLNPRPAIQHSDDPPDRSRTVELAVLTYNVAGLPWPASSDRADAMGDIGRHIDALAASGIGVDVVLVQEGFINESEVIADRLGFDHRVTGGGRALSPSRGGCNGCPPDPRRQKWWKGEGIGAVVGSGLHIFSAHPIVAVRRMAFGGQACAGYDCLANKGAVLASIALPGLPQPVDIVTTHLNSTNAAGVPKEETHIAHERQVRRLASFWSATTHPDRPALIGGDFNIRGSHQRFLPLAKLLQGATFVKNTCRSVGGPTICDIAVRPETPWLTSQDLQAYRSGRDVTVTPVFAGTVLDKPVEGRLLSDHFGFLVRYRLVWNTKDAPGDKTPDQVRTAVTGPGTP